jgi:hypothetical protein
MAIGVLELSGLLPLTRSKQGLHLLLGVQGERAASGSRTGVPSGADFTIADAENFTEIDDFPASSTGVQLELMRPCGHITCSASQSIEKWVRS